MVPLLDRFDMCGGWVESQEEQAFSPPNREAWLWQTRRAETAIPREHFLMFFGTLPKPLYAAISSCAFPAPCG